MSNLPDIWPVKDLNGFGVSYIVIATPDFPNKGAWWQLVDALNGDLVTYGWANGVGGCMRRAADAGKKAARYRMKKKEKTFTEDLASL